MKHSEIQGVIVTEGTVRPEWIDVNDHMNVAWYVAAFDLGIDSLWERFGINDEYINGTQRSTFAVECHVTYKKELLEADPYIVTSQILAYDAKRLHHYQRLYHKKDGYLSATAEWLTLHVDLAVRRVSPWADEVLAEIGRFADEQSCKSRPAALCGHMHVKEPLYDIYENEN